MGSQPRPYKIGPHSILLPHDHMLDRYQEKWKRYDIALGEIARIAFTKYPELTAIDVGANIGDSAALICKHQNIPVLCIEGVRKFIWHLHENIARNAIPAEIEDCFIGDDGHAVGADGVSDRLGTASIIHATADLNRAEESIKMKSLKTILNGHQRFSASKLLKMDTDGFDFIIIRKSIDLISEIKPIIFLEYDINYSAEGETQGIAALYALHDAGYTKFLVYDNYGNFLISIEDSVQQFLDLNAFLRSNRKHGFAVYYFDICALHGEDADLFQDIRRYELS